MNMGFEEKQYKSQTYALLNVMKNAYKVNHKITNILVTNEIFSLTLKICSLTNAQKMRSTFMQPKRDRQRGND